MRGETQAEARRRKKAEQKRDRRSCIAYIRQRDRHHCRLCARPVQYAYELRDDFGEVHEYIFRSRGGSDTDPRNTVLVCKGCHTLTEPCIHPGIGHRSKKVIEPLDDDALMEGPISYRVEHFDEPHTDDEHTLARVAG